MNIGIMVFVVLAVIVVYLVSVYNHFVTLKTQITASIQEIGNQLKRQSDLIPNLEESVKGYLSHEKTVFGMLTDARKAVESAVKSGKMADLNKASESISQLLPKLQVLVESNPEIKGVEVVSKLMNELRDTSDKVMYSRRTVIDLTQEYNQLLMTFPSNLVGQMFGMTMQSGLQTPTSGDFLKVSEEETKTPKVNL